MKEDFDYRDIMGVLHIRSHVMVFVVSFPFSVLLVEPSTANCKTDTNLRGEGERKTSKCHTRQNNTITADILRASGSLHCDTTTRLNLSSSCGSFQRHLTQMLKGVSIAKYSSTWYIHRNDTGRVEIPNIVDLSQYSHLWARRKAVILKGWRGEKKMSTRDSSDTPSAADEQTSATVRERW